MRGSCAAAMNAIARAEARPHNAEPVVALLLQPVQAAADVDHTLPHGIERAPDICRDGVVGSLDLRGLREYRDRACSSAGPQCPAVEHTAQADVGERIRVPVRQQDYGSPSPRRKPARVHQIIFRIRRRHRRGESQKFRIGSLYLGLEFRVGNFARVNRPLLRPSPSRKMAGRWYE